MNYQPKINSAAYWMGYLGGDSAKHLGEVSGYLSATPPPSPNKNTGNTGNTNASGNQKPR